MNKFTYGERAVYEKDGRYIKMLEGEFVGEDTRAGALGWLYKACPYEVNFARVDGGIAGEVLNRHSGRQIASVSVIRADGETEQELRLRVIKWASMWCPDSEVAAACRRFGMNG